MSYIVILAGDAVLELINKFVTWDSWPDYLRVFMMYFGFILIWASFFAFVLIPKDNKPMIKALAFDKESNNFKGIAIGAAVGFVMNAACILFSVLLGDLDLSFDRFEIFPLLLILFGVMVQSGAEEVVTRLYLYQRIRRGYKNPIVAVVVNSVFFALLHGYNPNFNVIAFLQITLVGVMFSLMIHYFSSIWMCIMVHTLWNFTQNIIFGCPNSGIVSEYSIFKIEGATNGFFFDVGFGVEGSIGACLLTAAACVVIVLIGRKLGKKPVDLWADEERRLEAEALAQKEEAAAQ